MWGAEFLPQTTLIPLVDLVITHGGNNTTTEAFHFGKPMIVLPLFWDQYDNAQRVDETGFGVRLPTYAFEDAGLRGAIDRLLAGSLPRRMAEIGAEVRAKDGVARAADAIERVGLATERRWLRAFSASLETCCCSTAPRHPGRRRRRVTAPGGDQVDGWEPSVAGDGASSPSHRLRNRWPPRRVPGHRVRLAVDDESSGHGRRPDHPDGSSGGRRGQWMTGTGRPHPAAERLRRLLWPASRSPRSSGWSSGASRQGTGCLSPYQSYLVQDGWAWGLDEARRALGSARWPTPMGPRSATWWAHAPRARRPPPER
jgi:hypothetical protein